MSGLVHNPSTTLARKNERGAVQKPRFRSGPDVEPLGQP